VIDEDPAQPNVASAVLDRFDTLSGRSKSQLFYSEVSDLLSATPSQGETPATVAVSGGDIVSIAKPGSITAAHLENLRNLSRDSEDRLPEISDQIGSILPYFGQIQRMGGGTARYLALLLEATQSAAARVSYQIKFGFSAPRPMQYAEYLSPAIQTPSHSSYPSGHATEAFAIATMIMALRTGAPFDVTQLEYEALPFHVAGRIAQNREIAGVHFAHDTHAGAVFGIAVGNAIAASALGVDAPSYAFEFNGFTVDGAKTPLPKTANLFKSGGGGTVLASQVKTTQSELLSAIFAKAQADIG